MKKNTLCEKCGGNINIYELTLNAERLKSLRETELGLDRSLIEGNVYRYVTNDRQRIISLLRSKAGTSKEMTETKKHFRTTSDWGYFEEYNKCENYGGVFSDDILRRYADGMFDEQKTLPVEIEDFEKKLDCRYLLLNKEKITRIRTKKIGMFNDCEEAIYLADGIISLTPTLFTLENILSGNLFKNIDSSSYASAIEVFDVSESPIKVYTEADINEIERYAGKCVFEEKKLTDSAKILTLVRGRKEGI